MHHGVTARGSVRRDESDTTGSQRRSQGELLTLWSSGVERTGAGDKWGPLGCLMDRQQTRGARWKCMFVLTTSYVRRRGPSICTAAMCTTRQGMG